MLSAPIERAAAAIVAGLLCAGGTPATSAPADHQAPIVLVEPTASVPAGDALVLSARIRDPSGVAQATAWVKSGNQTAYHAVAMTSADGEHFVALLEPNAAEPVTYYVEATDTRGNGPRRSGSPRSPFVVEIANAAAAATAPAQPARGLPRWPLAAGPLAGFAGWWGVRGRRRPRRRRAAPVPAIAEQQGMPRIPHASLAALWNPTGPHAAAAEADRREVEEEVYWLNLLAPLLTLEPQQAEDALREIASGARAPGARSVDLSSLRERLRRCRETDPWELVARWKAMHPERRAAAGTSLVEMLVVLAVLCTVLGLGAVSFDAFEAPVRRGTDLVLNEFRQARALAMSTTTAHRVRAASARRLVIERAPSCSSLSWTREERLDLELPDQVTLDESDWLVCFDTRGLASANLVATLDHPRYASRRIEVLLGGAARILQ